MEKFIISDETAMNVAMNLLGAKMSLDRVLELLDGYGPVEEIRGIKEHICTIENALT